MATLTRYIEWMSRGRRTNREAYVLEEWDLPKPVPDAEWQLDKAFNLADELLRDPEIRPCSRWRSKKVPRSFAGLRK